ncbi:hypothetical protein BCF74_11741 [Knoellia remsis]|uniref:Uncharacterized protein n=1 Tax=Knoellia remsis TaxID=407159 RepID=A0A2T0UGQ2_9MICO|nr:hypothetical protein [Knoellia remsis]PRY57036.1 hypothetical protein BCF74_11741 [Knoellia remsis]
MANGDARPERWRREVVATSPDGRRLTVVAVPTCALLRTEAGPDPISNPVAYVVAPLGRLLRRAARPRWKVGVRQDTGPLGAPKIITRTVLPPRVTPDELMDRWVREIEEGRVPTT